MKYHNRRHSSGILMPNIFFILQLTGIALLVTITMQVIPLFTLSVYLLSALALLAVAYCIDKRSTVINRQKHYLDIDFLAI